MVARVSFVMLGSIPARAGEPSTRPGIGDTTWVYPRTCGGTHSTPAARASHAGLSPHVRGNLGVAPVLGEALGSIPARAGEPCGRRPGAGSIRVYPRTCGGTVEAAVQPERGQGLSPHVRGNLQAVVEHPRVRGSIPARAGEPAPTSHTPPSTRVYPRTCGGTLERADRLYEGGGLSPHVRGNHGH